MRRTLLIGVVGSVLVALGVLASRVLIAGGPAQAEHSIGASSSHTASPAQPVTLSIPADPLRAPSAMGERLILQLLGVVPAPPPPAAVAPSGAPSGAPGADVRVNNPALDTPENTTQSETTLAVRGNTICGGYNDSGPGAFTGFSRSTNLGTTWSDQGGLGQSGDPVLAVHKASGKFYYAMLATINAMSAIGVSRSTDDCQTFGAVVNASPASQGATHLQDKPWIAVDNTGGSRDGYVYACWTRFVNNFSSGEIRFSLSTDGGLTFANDQVISGGGATFPFGCSIDVGPNGDVYVLWADRGANYNIVFRRSTNGGLAWDPEVQVNSAANRHPGIDRVVTCEAPRTTLNGDIRMLHQAWLAVDTTGTGGLFNGNLYAVWASDPTGAIDNSDVYYSRSTNGGLNWSPQVQVAGGTTTDQFEPFVEVGGVGAVSVAWYDRRNDPGNNLNIDVYKLFSRNGGATLDPIVRVTDQSFPVPPINPNFDPLVVACYMGEYIAIAADRYSFYYAWGDNRTTLVTPSYPAGRPDPDVFFDRQAAPLPATVGGIIEPPDLAQLRLETADSGGSNVPYIAGAAVAGALLVVAASGWYARRRRLR